jgi:hypothetical protein
MITAYEAMEQAHATARKYAYEGIKAFEGLTGLDPKKNPQALATFVAGFMQAASIDFAAWAIQNQMEGFRNDFQRVNDEWQDIKRES